MHIEDLFLMDWCGIEESDSGGEVVDSIPHLNLLAGLFFSQVSFLGGLELQHFVFEIDHLFLVLESYHIDFDLYKILNI